MAGWIKLHRQFMKWEWYSDPNTCRLFLHLLLSANHKDGSHMGTPVLRGQVKTGRKKLAHSLKLTEKQIRLALNHLKGTGEVAIKGANTHSIITIINWDTYQLDENEKGQQEVQPEGQRGANEGPTKGQRGATFKNVKKDKNEKNEKNGKKYNAKSVADGIPWLDSEIWSEWIDYRKKIKASNTERAIKGQLNTLEKLGTSNANAIIAQSLDNGWKGFFVLKGNGQATKPQSQHERNMEVLREVRKQHGIED